MLFWLSTGKRMDVLACDASPAVKLGSRGEGEKRPRHDFFQADDFLCRLSDRWLATADRDVLIPDSSSTLAL